MIDFNEKSFFFLQTSPTANTLSEIEFVGFIPQIVWCIKSTSMMLCWPTLTFCYMKGLKTGAPPFRRPRVVMRRKIKYELSNFFHNLSRPLTIVMCAFIDTIKAIITRLIFATHGVVAIYRVVTIKNDLWFWYLSTTILILFFEGVFTLAIKKTQEWKW